MGEAFNHLADQIDQLLIAERESAADLSHRLRTPLTSLRLQAESLGDPAERAALIEQADRLEHATSQVIELARAPHRAGVKECDLDHVIGKRAAFWSVLAEEQARALSMELASSGRVALGEDQVEVLVDTLIGNVFAHTPPGTGFEIRTGNDQGAQWLEVADRGPGFGNKAQPVRGKSGAGSTGLGLDIVVKIAETVGGDLEIDDRPGGGAVVRVMFG
jgi:signal transduction histidine kinase